MRHGLRFFAAHRCVIFFQITQVQLHLAHLPVSRKNRFTKKERSSNCFPCERGPPWKHPFIFIWLQKMSTKIPQKTSGATSKRWTWKRTSNSSKTSDPSARGLDLGQTPLVGQCPAAHVPSLQAGFIRDGQTRKIPPILRWNAKLNEYEWIFVRPVSGSKSVVFLKMHKPSKNKDLVSLKVSARVVVKPIVISCNSNKEHQPTGLGQWQRIGMI